MFLGAKEPTGETVLLLDVESGSVAAGLARLEKEKLPRLFGANRHVFYLPHSLSASALLERVAHAAREVLSRAATVAARLRSHRTLKPLGEVSKVELFLSSPWTNLETQTWKHDEASVKTLADTISAQFGYLPLVVHPLGRPLASVAHGLFEEDEMLITNVTGEITELLLLRGSTVARRATLPFGHHFFARTLTSHAGFSEAEARSVMRLYLPPSAQETLATARSHFAEEFREVARTILPPSMSSVVVIAHEPIGEWFARAFAESAPFEELFPDGGTVRALRPHHLLPHLETGSRDLLLMLEALFVDAEPFAARSHGVYSSYA